MEIRILITLVPSVNVIKIRISILQTVSPYFSKTEHGSLDLHQLKYGENIHRMEIQILITLAPIVNVIKIRISILWTVSP